jgi:hypothetical protein
VYPGAAFYLPGVDQLESLFFSQGFIWILQLRGWESGIIPPVGVGGSLLLHRRLGSVPGVLEGTEVLAVASLGCPPECGALNTLEVGSYQAPEAAW